MRPVAVLREDGTPLAPAAQATETYGERMAGWIGRAQPGEGAGLWIRPCASIHTFGMRFAVDVAFLDLSGRVLSVAASVPPGRLRFGPLRGWFLPFAVQALELPAGALAAAGVGKGSRLRVLARGEGT